MTNALPRNAQAKIIEREFRNFTFLSRLFDGYCGSNVVAKPEKLKHKLKAGNIPTDGELTQVINEMIDGYFNMQPYNGKVVADRGKAKMQVYVDHLPQTVRRAAPDDLYLLMMRSTRAQTVGKMVYISRYVVSGSIIIATSCSSIGPGKRSICDTTRGSPECPRIRRGREVHHDGASHQRANARLWGLQRRGTHRNAAKTTLAQPGKTPRRYPA